MSAVSISVNLSGSLLGQVRHTTRQNYSVDVSSGSNKLIISKDIIHTDREQAECCRVTNIAENVVNEWVKNEAPAWEKQKMWKTYSQKKRIASYVDRFDEGYGVSFIILD